MNPSLIALNGRTLLCGLLLSVPVLAQCPAGGYPPPPPAREGSGPVGPANDNIVIKPPSSPGPAGPSAPAPSGPSTKRPRGPVTGGIVKPTTGGRRGAGMPITLDRGPTSKRRLTVSWKHPVPPKHTKGTAAVGPLSRKEAIARLWDDDDGRPLLVLRECKACVGSDSALLSRSLKNDKTMLLTKWFRTVKLPAHIWERNHPFHNVFAGYQFGKKVPHFFFLADKDSKPVAMSGVQTQSKLWKTMYQVLDQRYAKSAKRQVKKWLLLLDRYDTIEGRRVELKEKLLAARATYGPNHKKTKKIVDTLAGLDKEWAEVEAAEEKIRDLGLLKPIAKVSKADER